MTIPPSEGRMCTEGYKGKSQVLRTSYTRKEGVPPTRVLWEGDIVWVVRRYDSASLTW